MPDLKLPPKLSLKKPTSESPASDAAPQVAAPAAVAEAPAPVAQPAAAVPVQPKPAGVTPRLVPKAPVPVAAAKPAPTASPLARPIAGPMGAMKPATTGPGSGIKAPTGMKPIALNKPIPVGAARPVATPVAAPVAVSTATAKRQTSRVELGAAVKASAPLDMSDLDDIPVKDASKPDAKRMTAKISLDAALAPPETDDGGPKTIRLKRPGEASAPMKASALGAPRVSEKTADLLSDDNTPLSRTAKIETPDAEQDDAGRKRTIRVKRAGGTTATTAPQTRRPAAMDVQLEDVSPAGEPHWFFVLAGVAALVVAILNLYVILAGSIPSLPWLGRIS